MASKRKQREAQKLKEQKFVQKQTLDRARLRKSYRSVDTNVKEGHSGILQELNALHKRVEHPRESVLDGQYVSNLGKSILKSARLYEIQSKVSCDEWISSLKESSFKHLGEKALSHFIYKAPSIQLLAGLVYQDRSKDLQLASQPTQKLTQTPSDRSYVAEIANQLETNEDAYKKAFNHKIRKMSKVLSKGSHFDCNELLINPDSFGNTVENLFHFSFLIAEGKAKWSSSDDHKDLTIESASSRRLPSDISRNSSVFKITFDSFKNRCQKLKEGETVEEEEENDELLEDKRPTKRKRLAVNR